MAKIIEQYTNGNGSFFNMKPGTIVFDYNLSSSWRVISNDGEKVRLQNLKGGRNGVKMTVDEKETVNTFCLLDEEGTRELIALATSTEEFMRMTPYDAMMTLSYFVKSDLRSEGCKISVHGPFGIEGNTSLWVDDGEDGHIKGCLSLVLRDGKLMRVMNEPRHGSIVDLGRSESFKTEDLPETLGEIVELVFKAKEAA